jgi:2,4-dienoyl-CoA reductase-like NADH-dependent reductase (Old Yellow Enzyme family)
VPVVVQITHKGRRGHSEGNDFRPLLGPSPVREPNHRETPHELDRETIAEIVRAFADAAFRLKRGGFDGCEVMASACHLVDQFWTPRVNRRTDEFGGDLAGAHAFRDRGAVRSASEWARLRHRHPNDGRRDA